MIRILPYRDFAGTHWVASAILPAWCVDYDGWFERSSLVLNQRVEAMAEPMHSQKDNSRGKGQFSSASGPLHPGRRSGQLSRRDAIAATVIGGTVALSGAAGSVRGQEVGKENLVVDAKKGRLNQSLCRWCFSKIELDELAATAARMGLVGIDLMKPEDFPLLKKHGLVCTMVTSHPLTDGLCDPKYHDMALEKLNAMIEATAAEGWRNVITFSGNARGIDRETGMKNCVDALRKIVPVAEKKGVILNMELLNSKVDHPDYMCDNTTWGVELCKRVGSDNFKLLYDIYHMQIMEGDIIRTIQRDYQYFGHYHTAGNPGRHELDSTQELFYPPIAKAIADTGFDGYFAHEFIPTRDPIQGLAEAVQQCVV